MPRASYSMLSTYRACPKKYAYRYVDGLSKDSIAGAPLLIGSWFHAVLAVEAIQRGIERGSLLDVPDDLSLIDDLSVTIHPATMTLKIAGDTLPLHPSSIITICGEWWDRLESDRHDEIIERAGAPLPERLGDLLDRYLTRWKDRLAEEEPLLVEVLWKREVPGTETTITGRSDQVYRNPARGIVAVRDHKLVGRWPSEPDSVLDLMDSQLHLYAWGAAQKMKDLAAARGEEPITPNAVEFDRIRYVMPKTPRLTKAGNLSKQVTDFDLPTYIAFTEEEGLEPDEKVVAELHEAPDRFFRRRVTPINVNVIREHLRAAHQQTTAAQTITSSKDAPRSPSSSCSWCDFLAVCRGQMVGSVPDDFRPSDYGLKRRERSR